MLNTHELSVTVLNEAGYKEAIEGVSYNKNQEPEKMPAICEKLATHDYGHNKFLEHIHIWLRVRAPRYWWQEADTFRLSSKNSQSTMHTIMKGYLEKEDFECQDITAVTLSKLNDLITAKKLVELKRRLPEGFMQKRMWQMSYKTLRNIIIQRKHHKLPHWQTFIYDIQTQLEHGSLLPF